MHILATLLLLSSVALSLAIPDDYYNPLIVGEYELTDGEYKYLSRELVDEQYGCWYLRFKVKSTTTVFIKFSPSDDHSSDEYYEVMIGAWDNKQTCIRKGRKNRYILEVNTPKILTGKWQYFYIKQSYNYWEIGYEDKRKVIGYIYDDAPYYGMKYVAIRSIERSWWRFYYPGFGRSIFKTEILKPEKYAWIYPEIYEDYFYLEFAVKAKRDASIVFSPTNDYGDDIYEIIIGAEDNFFCCLRRKKGQKPIVDVHSLDILYYDDYRYFWIKWYGHRLTFGRYGEDVPLIDYLDDNPLRIKYFGVSSYYVASWWKFYFGCPTPTYICEKNAYTLSCPGGYINIKYALYGRQNGVYCPHKKIKQYRDCGDPDHSYDVLRRECAGKENCTIEAKNKLFGDPCVNTYKYLVFDYECCYCD